MLSWIAMTAEQDRTEVAGNHGRSSPTAAHIFQKHYQLLDAEIMPNIPASLHTAALPGPISF